MGDANPIRTLGDYSKPSHEGYMNTIELPVGNNVNPNNLPLFDDDKTNKVAYELHHKAKASPEVEMQSSP
ncbi:hypothetical protein Tco_0694041 [Tanacetum coccineum]